MRHLVDHLRAPARGAADHPAFSPGKLAVVGAALLAVAALLFPSTAAAVPGSGEFVALETNSGREITELYNMIAKICLGVLIVVEGALLVAIVKFRRTSEDENPVQNHGDLRLEFGWTMAAIAIQVWIGVTTINVMFSTETPPENVDMTVTAHAEMWDWNFEYDIEDRDRLIHEDLVVPAHANVKIQTTSEDVLHSIFVPALGIKMDAVPGRFNQWWFRADGPVAQVRADNYSTLDSFDVKFPQTRTGELRGDQRDATDRAVTGLEQSADYLGRSRSAEDSPYAGYNAVEYQGTCAELCGTGHWDMWFRAVVMTQSSFDRWYRTQLETVEEPDGESIFTSNCSQAGCHATTGEPDADDVPSLTESEMVNDEERVDEHIEQVLVGPNRMPSFRGSLNDAEIAAVVNHERTSWGNDGGTVEPADIAEMRESLDFSPFPAASQDPVDRSDLMSEGERLYQSCASCHGADGQSPQPELVPDVAGSDVVTAEEPVELTRLLVRGRDTDEYPGKKPPLAESMSDRQLAALLTYVRQSFGNDAPVVQPYDIESIREEIE